MTTPMTIGETVVVCKSEHTLSLCLKQFESLVKLAVVKWKWLHLQAPADVKQYHNLFTSLMQ